MTRCKVSGDAKVNTGASLSLRMVQRVVRVGLADALLAV